MGAFYTAGLEKGRSPRSHISWHKQKNAPLLVKGGEALELHRSYHEDVLILRKLLILLGANTALDGLDAAGCYNRATKIRFKNCAHNLGAVTGLD
jgi:hypothetical protein